MSSNEIAIRVTNLSKCYEIYDSPHIRLKQFVLPRLQRLAGLQPRQYFREFWALRDVSFEVKKGETIGIIGRNGSGKSTLLQIICGTLTPTSGSVETRGRIAALLELGSGFNPEFTGRENVYMNAALLGLSKEEVDARFDDIAAFADIGDFIEQPVKNYSSGMVVRLAFAVAINIDPETLIVDEALSVGDIQFQMKCFDRMEEVRSSGATILFVTHSLEQIKRFCTSAVWLEKGEVRLAGDSNYVSDQFRDTTLLASAKTHENDPLTLRPALNDGSAPAIIKSVVVSSNNLAPFEPLTVRITYTIGDRALPKILLGVAIKDSKGTYIFGPNTHLEDVDIPHVPGTHVIDYVMPRLPLLTGTYLIDVGLFTDAGLVCIDYIGNASKICVVANYFSEGVLFIEHEWKIIRNE